MPEDEIPHWGRALSRRVDDHDLIIKRLDEDMTEIRETLRHTATKADVLSLENHINLSVNGVLKDALNSIPAKWSTIMIGLSAIGGIIATVIALTHAH